MSTENIQPVLPKMVDKLQVTVYWGTEVKCFASLWLQTTALPLIKKDCSTLVCWSAPSVTPLTMFQMCGGVDVCLTLDCYSHFSKILCPGVAKVQVCIHNREEPGGFNLLVSLSASTLALPITSFHFVFCFVLPENNLHILKFKISWATL